jgi:hypothetical protein
LEVSCDLEGSQIPINYTKIANYKTK